MKISVLIPCYNSDKYILRCINSVLNQTYNIYQILVVNDGSTDNSLKILEDVASKNSNVKIITQKNLGLSETRNVLIRNSDSDYFYFLDSDDWLDNDCIENFVKKNLNKNYEMIFNSCYKNNKIFKRNSNINNKTTIEIYCINNYTYVWNIFINREFWNKHNFQFYNNHTILEDAGIFTYIMSKTKNAGFINKPGYHYFINKESLSRIFLNERKIQGCIEQIQYLYNLLNKEFNKKYPIYINDNIALTLSIILIFIIFQSKDISKIKYIRKLKKIESDNGRVKFPKCRWKFIHFLFYRMIIW